MICPLQLDPIAAPVLDESTGTTREVAPDLRKMFANR